VSAVPGLTQPYGVGYGQQLPFIGVNPAAGANFTRSFDGYGIRRLLALVFTLTTDGNAANRYVTVEYQGKDANAFTVNAATVVVTASSTQRYAGDIWKGDSEWNTGTDVLFGLANIMLMPGDTLNIIVANIQVGDTLTKIRGVEERYPLNPDILPIAQSE